MPKPSPAQCRRRPHPNTSRSSRPSPSGGTAASLGAATILPVLHMRHVSSMGEIQDFLKSVISATLMTRAHPPPSEFHVCTQARGTNSTLSAVGEGCGTSTQILLSRIHFLAKTIFVFQAPGYCPHNNETLSKNQLNINKVIRRSMCNWGGGGGGRP